MHLHEIKRIPLRFGMYLLDLKRSLKMPFLSTLRVGSLTPFSTEPCKEPKLEGPDMNIDMHMTKYILQETEVTHRYVYISTKQKYHHIST